MSNSHFSLPRSFWVAAPALVILAMQAQPAGAQSFDCRAAYFRDERAICDHPDLARLDQQLNSVFRQDIGRLSAEQRDQFQQNEVLFVQARRRCGENAHCIAQSYRNRIQELQNLTTPSGQNESFDREGPSDAARLDRRTDRPAASDRTARVGSPTQAEPTDAVETSNGTDRSASPRQTDRSTSANVERAAKASEDRLAKPNESKKPEMRSDRLRQTVSTTPSARPEPGEAAETSGSTDRSASPRQIERSFTAGEDRSAKTSESKKREASSDRGRQSAAITPTAEDASAAPAKPHRRAQHSRSGAGDGPTAAPSAQAAAAPSPAAATSGKPTIRWADPPPAR